MKSALKRFVSIFLIIALFQGMCFSLTSCELGNKNKITNGEWLGYICDTFGMYSYSSKESHIKSIDKSNPYYDAVQVAYEWNIISGSEFDTDAKLTNAFAAKTLVKAVGFEDVSEKNDLEIVKFAIQKGYVTFTCSDDKDIDKVIKKQDALDSLDASFKIWTNRDYGQPKETVEFKDGVKDLTFLNSSQFVVDEDNNSTIIEGDCSAQFAVGDVYVLPATESNDACAYRIKAIEVVDGNTVLINENYSPEMEDVIANMSASGSVSTRDCNYRITDGIGNVVYSATKTMSSKNDNSLPIANSLNINSNQISIRQLKSVDIDFSVGGLNVKGRIADDFYEFSVGGEINLRDSGNPKENDLSLKVNQSWKVNDFGYDYQYETGWFKDTYAYAAVRYTVEDKKEFALEYDKTKWIKNKYHAKNQILATSLKDDFKPFKVYSEKEIPICSIDLNPTKIITLSIDFKVHVTVTGSLELVCTTKNAKGVEWKNNSLRFVKDESKDVDCNINLNMEALLYIGLSFKVVNIKIVGFGVEGGIGVEVKGIIHVIDQDNRYLLNEISFDCQDANPQMIKDYLDELCQEKNNHEILGEIEIKTEFCFDINTYGILRIKLDSDCIIAKFIKGEVQYELFGKDHDNSKIKDLCFHFEDGQKVPECTRKYRAIPKNAKTTTSLDSTNSTTSTTSSTQQPRSIIKDNTYRDIVLVLDTSGSMEGTPFSNTIDSAKDFVLQVAGGNTRVGIVSYDTNAHLISQLSNNVSGLMNDIDGVSLGDMTNMYSGLSVADDLLKQSSAEKKIIILMSDGLPNESPNVYDYSYEPYGDEVVEYATKLKDKGYYIYTLGFFQNLSGEALVYGQDIMNKIAGEGYYYDINETDSINFFFNDVATDIAGQHSILVKIACPVDVYVTFNGETLTSDQSAPNNRTSFGSISYTGEYDEVKNVRLLEGANYDIVIRGTGEGTMTYSISYPDDSGAYTDVRTFEDIPITDKTVVETNTKKKRKTVVKLDSDGDGRTDVKYQAVKNGTGEVAPDYTNVIVVIAVLVAIGAAVKLIGLQRIKKLFTVKTPMTSPIPLSGQSVVAGYCGNCGGQLESGGSFCPHCGFDNSKVMMNTPQNSSSNAKFCGNCGHTLSSEAVYCDNCGHDTREDNK